MSVIRLLDSSGINMLDSISGEYEDSFSLETFEDLCKAHFEAEPPNTKGFIIARVQTWDPKQPEKEFYSYYDAFHLNKILFQTQIVLKKKYIHRLHVLNPLTNSDIIGNVEYYFVKPPVREEPQSPGIERSGPITISTSNLPKVDNSDAVSPSVFAIDRGQKPKWTVGKHKISNEEDLKSEKTQYPAPLMNSETKIVEVPMNSVFPATKSKKSHSLNISILLPDERPYLNNSETVEIVPGVVTQFSVPVPAEKLNIVIPKTQSGNRRALSYRNAVSASTIPVSFLEWTKLIEQDRNIIQENSEIDFDKFDASRFDNSTARESTSNGSTGQVYDAILFATDDDYLGSSKIRQKFADNALNPEEAKLFEMKEYTGENRSARRDDNLVETSMCSMM